MSDPVKIIIWSSKTNRIGGAIYMPLGARDRRAFNYCKEAFQTVFVKDDPEFDTIRLGRWIRARGDCARTTDVCSEVANEKVPVPTCWNSSMFGNIVGAAYYALVIDYDSGNFTCIDQDGDGSWHDDPSDSEYIPSFGNLNEAF